MLRIVFVLALLQGGMAFNAQLTRPWRFKRGHLRIRARKRKVQTYSKHKSTIVPPVSSAQRTCSLSEASLLSLSSSNTDDAEKNETQEKEDHRRMTPPLLEMHPSKSSVDQAGTTAQPTVLNQLGPLTRLTRPHNFPGIFLFHLIGVYITLQSMGRLDLFLNTLLARPTMWLVLASVFLVSSTSMVVNDYYDAKLGRDTTVDHPLVAGDLSFKVVRRYLSYLYALALMCSTLLPGTLARMSVVVSLMLTYWYTNHLKPLTWIKNLVCAFLIAFAPLTSSSATLHLVTGGRNPLRGLQVFQIVPIWRVVAMLFLGILGREMTMDCNDVENDQAVGVRTIPVVHGPAFASRVAFWCAGIASALAMAGPIYQIGRAPSLTWIRRLAFASAASVVQLWGAWKVWKTEGRNREVVSVAVDRGAMTILLFLASYL